MKEESKNTLKVLSKILEVVTIIGKVCSIIAIPCIALVMVCTPYVINNINVTDKKIEFKIADKKVVLMEEGKNDTKLKVKVGDEVVADEEEGQVIAIVNKLLKNTSKKNVIAAAETGLAFAIATIVFSIIVMNYAIKFFRNLGTKETPFIEENVVYLRKMAKFMTVALVLPIISGAIINVITGYDMGDNVKTFDLLEILALFVISYVFEYGVELQRKSKKMLYEVEKIEKNAK